MTAAVALAATTVVEVGVLLVLLVPRGVGAGRVVVVGVVANVVTHPLLWWYVSRHGDTTTSYGPAVVAGEIVVVAVEWLVALVGLRAARLAVVDVLGVVIVANAVTTAIGLTIALVR